MISGSGPLNVGSSVGSGTLTLSNTRSYTGATNVNSGTLAVTGDIRTSSLLTVNSSGTLAGTGDVGAVSVMDGGTFAPGTNTSTSQLNVHGNLTLLSAATYMVTINGSSSSFANVTGTATLNGAELIANSNSTGIALTQDYTGLDGDRSDDNRHFLNASL